MTKFLNKKFILILVVGSLLTVLGRDAAHAARNPGSGRAGGGSRRSDGLSLGSDRGDWTSRPPRAKKELRRAWQAQENSIAREGQAWEEGKDFERSRRHWRRMDKADKDRIRRRLKGFKSLPENKQERLQARWRWFENLPEDRKEKIRSRYEKWQELSKEEKERLAERKRRIEQMTPAERERFRRQKEKWRSLSSEERQALRKRFLTGMEQ